MLAFMGTSYDSVESFTLRQVALPIPGHGQVRLRIEATALGFVDGLMIQGRYQHRPPLPYVPGGEIAGVVDMLGPGVAKLPIGAPVVTWQLGGGLSEYVVVDASDVDVIEGELSAVLACSTLVDFQTAHYALHDRGGLSKADTVLVLGAAGGVGSAAVQMAARAGAFVIAAVSTEEKARRARALGAQATVNYRCSEWRRELQDVAPNGMVNLVVDPVGGSTLETAFRSLAPEGRYLVLGFAAGNIPSLPANLTLLKNSALIGASVRYFVRTQPERARRVRRFLYGLLGSGALAPPEVVRFPLEEARQAVALVMSRDKLGKVVVLPANA